LETGNFKRNMTNPKNTWAQLDSSTKLMWPTHSPNPVPRYGATLSPSDGERDRVRGFSGTVLVWELLGV